MVQKIIRWINCAVMVMTWVAGCAAVLTVVVIITNVVGRYFFRRPLHGTIEFVELMTVVLVYSVLPYTELCRRHVKVELVVSMLHRRTRAVLGSIMSLAGAAFFITMSWQAGLLAWANFSPFVRTTDTLVIPFAPFVFIIAIGSLLLALEMLINGFFPVSSNQNQGGK